MPGIGPALATSVRAHLQGEGPTGRRLGWVVGELQEGSADTMGDGDRQEMLIVAGMSRRTVDGGRRVEDLGWYVVDNLPPQMLRPLVDLAERAGGSLPRIAAVVDIRGGGFFSEIRDVVQVLRNGMNVRIMFLDADDAVLVRRFESVRRPHLLQGDGTLLDGIAAERARLAEVREASDLIVDTSDLNIHQLATLVTETFAEAGRAGPGSPYRASASSTGCRPTPTSSPTRGSCPIRSGMMNCARSPARTRRSATTCWTSPGAREFLDAYVAALRPVLEGYQRENKRHAMIAIGCTGGKHRSVALVRELAARLRSIPGLAVSVKHRDLGRE